MMRWVVVGSALTVLTCCTTPAKTPTKELSSEERTLLASLTLNDPAPPPDPTNRFADDSRAAALGHRFFFDKGFSGPLLSADNNLIGGTLGPQGERGRVSCEGCHVAKDGFSDTRTFGQRISLASDWVLRRTPSLLDVAQVPLVMWDGRHSTLFGQAIGPIESADEFNSSRLFLAQEIRRRYQDQYEAVFGPIGDLGPDLPAALNGCTEESFGRPFDRRPPSERGCHGMPGDRAEYDALSATQKAAVDEVAANFGKALDAYQRQLICGPSRFDEWLNGDASALSDQEVLGARLFVGRGNCISCHSGPFLSDHTFHNVGLRPERVTNFLINESDPGAAEGLAAVASDAFGAHGAHSDAPDIGAERLPETPLPDRLLGAFRTPMLRCVSGRPSFMHTAQIRNLRGVVQFFNRGGDDGGYLGTKELEPLGLSDDEVDAIVSFLEALDGPGPDRRWIEPPS